MDKDIIAQEINAEYLKGYIYSIKGVRVMLDMDLAKIYGYSTKGAVVDTTLMLSRNKVYICL